MGLEPLSEWSRVDLHDAVLDQSLRSHQLVVARIVHDIKDSTLTSDCCKTNRGEANRGKANRGKAKQVRQTDRQQTDKQTDTQEVRQTF